MRKYGEVLDYRTASKAVVGKKYIFGDHLRPLRESPEEYGIRELFGVDEQHDSPFVVKSGCHWQFCREVIEEEVRMTNRQLAEWLAKKNGERTYADENSSIFIYWTYSKDEENKAVPDDIRIRYWGSDEWVVPTLDIYERDCKGVK